MDRLALPLIYLIAWLPLPVLRFLSVVIGTPLALLPSGKKKAALTNLRACYPEQSDAWHQRTARRSLVHEMNTLFEVMRMWVGPASRVPKAVKQVQGMELVDAAFARGKGLILLTPHLGNGEAAGFHCCYHHDLHGVYKPQKGLIDDLSLKGRGRFGAVLIPTDGRPVGIQVSEMLNDNHAVLILPDQDPPAGRGVFAPFFGVPAHSSRLVAVLRQHTEAEVLFMFGYRLPWGRGFRVEYVKPPAGAYSTDPVENATALNQAVEDAIRREPDQFWWSYKRFRRRPEGEPPFYPR